MANSPGQPPPSSTISWYAVVLQADPNFQKAKQEQPAYEFANGRTFFQKYPNPYSTP